MNYDVLARRLQSWLAPEDLVAAARALAQDREAAFEQTSLALSASVLTSSQDGGLRTMCEEFVKRFEVPGNVIRFLRNSIIEKHGDLDWDALERLRFEGR